MNKSYLAFFRLLPPARRRRRALRTSKEATAGIRVRQRAAPLHLRPVALPRHRPDRRLPAGTLSTSIASRRSWTGAPRAAAPPRPRGARPTPLSSSPASPTATRTAPPSRRSSATANTRSRDYDELRRKPRPRPCGLARGRQVPRLLRTLRAAGTSPVASPRPCASRGRHRLQALGGPGHPHRRAQYREPKSGAICDTPLDPMKPNRVQLDAIRKPALRERFLCCDARMRACILTPKTT